MDLLASLDVHIFLAGLGTPSLESLLGHDVVLVITKEDGRDQVHELRVIHSNEALSTTEQGLLVTVGGDQLLEEGGTVGDLLDNLVVEHGLGKNSESSVLGFNSELLGFLVDVNVADLRNTALLLGSADDQLPS